MKSKTAALHYKNVIRLLHSSAPTVGNIGHVRNQMVDTIKAFQAYLNRKIRDTLLKPLPATGLQPPLERHLISLVLFMLLIVQ